MERYVPRQPLNAVFKLAECSETNYKVCLSVKMIDLSFVYVNSYLSYYLIFSITHFLLQCKT